MKQNEKSDLKKLKDLIIMFFASCEKINVRDRIILSFQSLLLHSYLDNISTL